MTLALGTNGVRGLFHELGPAAAMDFGFGLAQFARIPQAREPAGGAEGGRTAAGGRGAGAKGKGGKAGIRDAEGARSERTGLAGAPGPRPRVMLARDMRLTSPALAQATAAGLMEGGCDVLDIGIATSPLAEWAHHRHGTDALVIVTASHNPPEWNALKFVDRDGVAVSRERGGPIQAFVGQPHAPAREWGEVGRLTREEGAIAEYQKAVLAFVDRKAVAKKKGWKVVLDPGNGTSTLVAPALFRALGAETVVINEELDGRFPSRPSEPAEAHVRALIERVVAEGADFGVALDGDADRVVFVDERGRWQVGDRCVALSSLWALETLKRSKRMPKEAHVVTTAATSRVVQDVAERYGALTDYTDVGAPYLAERMHQLGEKAVAGGEEVGGIVWPRFTLAKDGVLAACKLMEMVAERPLGEWADDLPRYHNAKTKIACAPGENARLAAKVQAAVAAARPKGALMRPLQGGFRVDSGAEWALVRASGTEDYVRVFAEAREEGRARALMDEYKKRVEEIIGARKKTPR